MFYMFMSRAYIVIFCIIYFLHTDIKNIPQKTKTTRVNIINPSNNSQLYTFFLFFLLNNCPQSFGVAFNKSLTELTAVFFFGKSLKFSRFSSLLVFTFFTP